MALLDINQFVSKPSVEQLDKCRKDDLKAIADHFVFSVYRGLVKKRLKLVVCEWS